MRLSYLLFAHLLVGCGAPATTPPSARAPATASRTGAVFEFHSDPWVNLNQRIFAEATADQYWHTKVATCGCAQASDGTVSPPWAAAVSGYKADLGDRNPTFDEALAQTNVALALAGMSPALPEGKLDPVVVKWLPSVYGTYMAGQWSIDDGRNRAWITAAEQLVARWGRDIAEEYTKRFHTAWPEAPIRVEVTQYAGFGGAYTTPDPILTTMSSEDEGYGGPAALEMLFHEASHGLDGVLTHELQMAFIAKGKREPRSLDHAIIFYTAGELVRRRLGPSYRPYGYARGIWSRGWERYEAALRVHWQAWLDDRIDLQTALARLADALP